MYKFIVPLVVLIGCAEQSVVPPIIAVTPDAGPMISEFGGACVGNDDCGTNVCETSWAGVEMPGGLCTRPCVWGTPCDEGVCVGNNDASQMGFCWPSCESNDDCREGWVCAFLFTTFCAPAATVP